MITQDELCNAISVRWAVAHEAVSKSDLEYRWRSVEEKIKGMWLLLNYSGQPEEILEDCKLLEIIAHQYWLDSWTIQEAA